MRRRTKIVATLGPASSSPRMLDALLEAGMDVARLNLSHGPVEDHLAVMAEVRAAAGRAGRHVAVLADLPGPKVRAGAFPDGGVTLETGSMVRVEPGDGPSDDCLVRVDYPSLSADAGMGDRIVIGDGAICLEVRAVDGECLACEVMTGGPVQGRPGVHLPSERFRLRSPTPEDLIVAQRVADAGADMLAVSFVRSAADLRAVRDALDRPVRLVAKIETQGAMADLPAIVDEADAVMVARGDLGIELPLEDVPHLQKRIIRHCVELGIPVVTATQMLESMVTAPAPTRAEVSDVANAVFDGTDAVMLSGETAIGHDPAGVVRTMARITARAEAEANYRSWAQRVRRTQFDVLADAGGVRADRVTLAITHAAWQAADDTDVAAIVCCTRSGRTVQAMARFRPPSLMIGLSPDLATVRFMSLVWGVVPLQVETYGSTDDLVWHAVERCVNEGEIARGDYVLVLAGAPDRPGNAATDVLRVVRVD